MRILIISLLIIAAHFSLTPFAPAASGKGWILWPFEADSQPWLSSETSLPRSLRSTLTPILAGIAGLGFLAAAFSLIGWIVPADWWRVLVVVSSLASVLLYFMYLGRWALLPLAIDIVLLWGLLAQNWSVAGLQGIEV